IVLTNPADSIVIVNINITGTPRTTILGTSKKFFLANLLTSRTTVDIFVRKIFLLLKVKGRAFVRTPSGGLQMTEGEAFTSIFVVVADKCDFLASPSQVNDSPIDLPT